MGSTSDKISGLASQAAGKVKEGVGKATGDAKLETEGAAQDAKGKVQKGIGDAKGAIKDAVNKTFEPRQLNHEGLAQGALRA
jgi:uncharacterized protein YjbJ (UPF0337 family)